MNIIFILSLCLLATAKVTFQGLFAKSNIKTTSDAIFFNGLVFAFSSLIFVKDIFSTNLTILLYAAIFGILTVIFQSVYISGMSCGNVSMTVLIVNLSMVLPISVSVIFYDEKLSALRIFAICLTLISLILSVDSKSNPKNFKKWFAFSLIASLCNGGLSVCQKVFSRTPYGTMAKPFVATSYAVATLAAFLICFIFAKTGSAKTYKFGKKVILHAISVGVVLGLFQLINTKAIAAVDASLLFPSYYGGTVICSYISGLVLLKEKLTKKQSASFIIGLISIILINI